jgi:hypothetical protein
MKKTIRDGVANLGMSICRMADGATAQAKEYALDALDGDAKAQSKALEYRAQSKAYMSAVKAIDELRIAIERGDFA